MQMAPALRRVTAIVIATAAVLAADSGLAQGPAASRPNILFIMTDDHAAHAIGAYGSKVNATPNLDRIAREGALLTRVFATNTICTPSRAAILTGQYSHLNGVTVFNRFDSSRTASARSWRISTRSRFGCRSSCGGPRASSQARRATR